jgi:hypothetical protein
MTEYDYQHFGDYTMSSDPYATMSNNALRATYAVCTAAVLIALLIGIFSGPSHQHTYPSANNYVDIPR